MTNLPSRLRLMILGLLIVAAVGCTPGGGGATGAPQPSGPVASPSAAPGGGYGY